jgi:hypothetical protein
MRIAARVALVAFLSLVVATTTGLLASNSLPATKLGQNATAVTANGLKPADCASISLTNTVTGSPPWSPVMQRCGSAIASTLPRSSACSIS